MIDFSLHIATNHTKIPSEDDFTRWISAVLLPDHADAEIAIRVVDEEESAELNQLYRDKKGPTNVLSFTLDSDPLVGDIAICAPVVKKEAESTNIDETAHWAHLTVHACYHLLGYDHLTESDAAIMEKLEINSLKSLGFENPYGDE
ncbi:MAG: rRNA maturation RNase YbeY [Gammaproteobacteria bacterium]|nr:rRNA maturation RNase YbeY [Gammaproteobacteria bacterium]